MGECFDASLVALRFLIAVAPHETLWIESLINNYLQHSAEKKRAKITVQYFKLCLNELRNGEEKFQTDNAGKIKTVPPFKAPHNPAP